MLLSMQEIELQLNEKFSQFGGEMDDLILKKRESDLIDIDYVENILHVTFPTEFVYFLKKYDIDNFSLGNVSFGIGYNYLNKIIEMNENNNFHNFREYENNGCSFIVIALSDPYTILLNIIDHKIYAIMSEENCFDKEPIATDFNKFFCGLGSVFLKFCSREKVNDLVGSTNQLFWEII